MNKGYWVLRAVNAILVMIYLSSVTSAGASLPVRLAGYWGGPWSGLAVAGNRAYIGMGRSLIVQDISDPSHPVEMGRSSLLPSSIRDIAISGNYAYIANDHDGLQIIDISNPYKPVRVGGFRIERLVCAVAVSGAYAYVFDDFGNLYVIDVSEPTGPFQAGCYAIPMYYGPMMYSDVVVSGHYAYITNNEIGLIIVDVSDPANPRKVGAYGGASSSCSVAVSGIYAYFVCDGGLQIIDLSNPASPQKIGEYASENGSVAVAGTRVYLSNWKLQVIDVSDPTSPVLEYENEAVNDFGVTVVSGDYLYGVSYGYGLHTANISDPSNITVVSSGGPIPTFVRSIAVSGNYSYVADDRSGLHVLDISNPAKPTRVGGCYMHGLIYEMVIDGQYIYMAASYNGLRIVDISNPTDPQVVYYGQEYDDFARDEAHGVAVSGNKAYVSRTTAGLDVLDISDRAHPVKIGEFTTRTGMGDIAVSGNYAYFAYWQSGLIVIDISNPANPVVKSSYYTEANDVAISGKYAYVADDNAGLLVFDVSNPLNPVKVAQCDTGDWTFYVAVSGDRAWVYDAINGMQIVDISNPLSPEIVGVYTNYASPYSITAFGDYACLANGEDGMLILQAAPGLEDTTPPRIDRVNVDKMLVATRADKRLVAKGDKLSVDVNVTDDVAVVGVTANGIPLRYDGINSWLGELTASDEIGMHRVRVVATDAAGNTTTNSSERYRIARVVGINGRGAYDAIISTAWQNFLFKYWGKVTYVDPRSFWLDDGSGNLVFVYHMLNLDYKNGDYVSVRGILTRDGNVSLLQAQETQMLKAN